jgi:restriction endonuclease Mrr
VWKTMTDMSPEFSNQRINQILKTVFELLWFEPQGLYVSDIVKYLKDAINFTEYETGYYPFAPYIPRFEVIVRIGTIPLVKAGWLEKTKNGRWFITNAGRRACRNVSNSKEFFEMSIQVFQEWKMNEDYRLTQFDSDPFNNASEYSWAQIKQFFEILDIKDIRVIVSSLLKALGCHITWTVPYQEDDSMIDMICSQDALGLKPPRMVVHIAKSSDTTTLEDVELFSRDLKPNDVGIFFSFGGTINGSREYVLEKIQPIIRIIDLERFVDIWKENLDKIDQAGYAKFPLRPIHFLALPDRLG